MRTHIGRYELVDPEHDGSSGGMGTVYKAIHPDLQVEVAIKEPHYIDPENNDEFRKEAQRTAQLRHSNIVEIYDADLDGGIPFLVMEFLPRSIHQILEEEGFLPWETAVSYCIQVCRALEYAHTRKPNVIHRDITPQNIFVTYDGYIKVIDFGIARATERLTVTSTGLFNIVFASWRMSFENVAENIRVCLRLGSSARILFMS